MRVTHLSLHDFRNYSVAEVGFLPGLNVIVGRNGQGKTNLVEAIAYFAALDSHRVSGDSALIRAGAGAGVARMRIAVAEREALLEIQINRDRPNRAQINRNAVKPRELPRWFSCVVFAPEDLSIARGEPALRRRFLDDGVTLRNPAFASTLADYDRVVRQRSSLLKSARGSGTRAALDATLAIWDQQLIDLGSRIMCERRSFVRDLAEPLARHYGALVDADHGARAVLSESVTKVAQPPLVSRETSIRSNGDDSSVFRGQLSQTPNCDVSRETLTRQFRDALDLMRRQEVERGMTLVGPHRDDVVLELNGLPVKGYASHGETWSFVLSLRLALAELLREHSAAGDPVIILDDVFAELDARRRSLLMEAVSAYEQVIVTVAVEGDIPAGQIASTTRISGGAVVEPDAGADPSGAVR